MAIEVLTRKRPAGRNGWEVVMFEDLNMYIDGEFARRTQVGILPPDYRDE